MAVKPHIRKNDRVLVLTGKDRGKSGRVLLVFPKRGRALVEKLNMIKRHVRPTPQNKQGGIIEKEGSLHLSNLMLICPKCDKSTRLGHRRLENGRNVRVCKHCGETLERG